MADPAYRVFLSHSSKDKVFVRELYRRLTRDGVACFFDADSLGPCQPSQPTVADFRFSGPRGCRVVSFSCLAAAN